MLVVQRLAQSVGMLALISFKTSQRDPSHCALCSPSQTLVDAAHSLHIWGIPNNTTSSLTTAPRRTRVIASTRRGSHPNEARAALKSGAKSLFRNILRATTLESIFCEDYTT